MTEYWRFFRDETSLLAFGLSFTLLSSVGQTFLVSLFVPSFLEEFALSEAGFGTLYSTATLVSAALLPWAGGWLDRMPLQRFTVGVVSLMVLSALLLASAWHLAVLGIALVGLRLSGQGLSSHTALTAMARYFERARGKALSISSLGYPLGEAVLPLLLTALIGIVGWRFTWLGLAVTVALLFGPLLVWLLNRSEVELDPRRLNDRGDGGRGDSGRGGEDVDGGRAGEDDRGRGGGDDEPADGVRPPKDWRRGEVLKDVRFWCVLPAALLPPFWATGLFLYQTSIARLKGWSVALMASAFIAFALARICFTLAVGGGIDRTSARRLFPFSSVPMGIGMIFLLFVESPWAAFVFMALLGVTMGMSGNLKAALWAELYGVRFLGGIKSMMAALMVVSTAAAPVLVGLLVEAGRLDALLLGAVASVVVGTVLALRILPSRGGDAAGARSL